MHASAPALTRRPISARFPLLALAAGFALVTLGVLSAKAQTAGGGGSLEREVMAQVNFARTQPALYAEFLAGFRPHYQGDLLVVPGERPLITHEGVHALDEAIRAMRHARPLPPLATSVGLSLAAADLAREQSVSGATGHEGGGGNPFRRMSRHGRWESHAGEAIDYGGATARRIVANLIIDDGVRDRGHRLNLLAADFAVAGVACAPHPRFRRMCVIDFAGRFDEAGAGSVAMAAGPLHRSPALASAPLAAWQRGR